MRGGGRKDVSHAPENCSKIGMDISAHLRGSPMRSDGSTPEPDPEPSPDATGPTPAALPRFDTKPYQTTGPAPLLGILLLCTVLPVTGFLVGLLASVIARWFYFVVLFPVIMGFLVGGVGWLLVKVGKARGPVV